MKCQNETVTIELKNGLLAAASYIWSIEGPD